MASSTMILPQFISGDAIDNFRALSQLLTDNAARCAIEIQLKQLLSSGRIGLTTNHLKKNIQFDGWELAGLTSVASKKQRVYYTPQLGEVLATSHQWGRRGLLLNYPLLPCLKVRGGLIKKWKEIGVSKPHIFYYPMELITVVETKQNTFNDHASRWCARVMDPPQDGKEKALPEGNLFVENLEPITPATTPSPHENDQLAIQNNELPITLEGEWEKYDGGWGDEETSLQPLEKKEDEKLQDDHSSSRFPPPNDSRKASPQQRQDLEKFNPCRIEIRPTKKTPNRTTDDQLELIINKYIGIIERNNQERALKLNGEESPGFSATPFKVLHRGDKHSTEDGAHQHKEKDERLNPEQVIVCEIHPQNLRPSLPLNEPFTSVNASMGLFKEKQERIQKVLELTIKLLQDLHIS